jgi:5-methyltetrahydrofolate--homocysteine methyltransferase
MEQIFGEIAEALIKGNAPLVEELVKSCLDQGAPPELILEHGLIAGMNVIGVRFKNDEVYMPEVMIAARAMNAGLNILDPVLGQSDVTYRGKVVLGTVQGDLHDVGKNLVSTMFRGGGFEVIDLGVDVAEENFVQAVREHRPDVLCLSALLTMTLPAIGSTISAVEAAGLRPDLVIMVGGAPVTPDFASRVGADGYAPDAAAAVEEAAALLRNKTAGQGGAT